MSPAGLVPAENRVEKFPSRERRAATTLEQRVSAIVVVRNLHKIGGGQSPLELCLRAALAEPWVDELVIVDQGNSDAVSASLRALKADRRDVRLAVAPRDGSWGAGANLGAQHARGRWLLFIDPGVVLRRGAVARLAAAGADAKAPWVVGGRLTDVGGRDRGAARAGALNAYSALAIALGLRGRKPVIRKGVERGEPAAVAAVSSALMLAPRADFEALGGFDEGFATDAADLDFCRRAVEAGGAVLFQPSASGVQVVRGPSPGRRQAQGLARFAAKSARTPLQRLFALIAAPALATLLGLKDLVAGRPPVRR